MVYTLLEKVLDLLEHAAADDVYINQSTRDEINDFIVNVRFLIKKDYGA